MRRPALFAILFVINAAALHSQIKSGLKFQWEFYGGNAGMKPADLNLIIDSEEGLSRFDFDQYYYYIQQIGYIRSFSCREEGSLKKISRVLPLGSRLKMRGNSFFSFSLGYEYFQKRQESFYKKEFTIQENSGNESQDILHYSPFEIEIGGHAVLAGVHIGLDVWKSLRLEGYLAAGSLWADCGFSFRQLNTLYWGDSGVERSDEIAWQQNGKGRSYVLGAGTQISWNLIGRFRLFMEGGWFHRSVKNLVGTGSRTQWGFTEN